MTRTHHRTISWVRRRKILKLIPPRRCRATSNSTGGPCGEWAIVGGVVCSTHGGQAPQVQAAAARRVTLAEALASGDRRHPLEVLSSALHSADVLAQQTQATVAGQDPLTVDMVEAFLESIKTQATMAKLVLDAGGGPGQWSAQEALRAQGAVLAQIVQEFARQLGHDPGSVEVAEAFAAARDLVVFKVKGRRPKAIEGGSGGSDTR